MDHKFTLITGASRGLGKELATQCAQLGHNLLLISLPNEGIVQLGIFLSETFGVRVFTQEWDLTRDEHLRELTHWILSEEININFLVNNAGIGGTSHFEHIGMNKIDLMIQLNMKAMVYLTNRLLPVLKQNRAAYILNIASLAGLSPMPYKVVYAASKAFVSFFSKGLHAELRKTGVSVSVAFPGGMATQPEISERMKHYKGLTRLSFIPVERIAAICIKRTLQGRKVILPGILTKVGAFLLQYLPQPVLFHSLRRNLKRELR